MIKQLGLAYLRVSQKHQTKWSPLKQWNQILSFIKNGDYKFQHKSLQDTQVQLDDSIVAKVEDTTAKEKFEAKGALYDGGISGWSREKRKKAEQKGELEFKNMIDLLKRERGRINHIFFFQKSRFGRNIKDLDRFEEVCDELYEKYNVIVYMHFIHENDTIAPAIDKTKYETFIDDINAERKQSTQKSNYSRIGKLSAWKAGILVHKAKLGYGKNVKDENGINRTKPNKYADLVKAWFKLAEKGHTINQIIKWTADQGWKTPKGADRFGSSQIREVLTSQFYLGKIKHTTKEWDEIKKKRVKEVKWNDSISHEAIISQAQFNKVQVALKSRNTKAHLPTDNRKSHPLSSKIKCLVCGSRFTADKKNIDGKHYVYLRCSSKHAQSSQADRKAGRVKEKKQYYLKLSKKQNWLEKYGKESKGLCVNKYHREEVFYTLIKSALSKLRFIDSIIDHVKRIAVEAGIEAQVEMEKELDDSRARLLKLKNDKKALVRMRMGDNPEIDLETYREMVQELDKDIVILQAQIDDLSTKNKQNRTELDKVLEIAHSLGKKWDSELTEETKHLIIEKAVLEINVEMESIKVIWAKPFDVLTLLGEKAEQVERAKTKKEKETILQGDRDPEDPGRACPQDRGPADQGFCENGGIGERYSLACGLFSHAPVVG